MGDEGSWSWAPDLTLFCISFSTIYCWLDPLLQDPALIFVLLYFLEVFLRNF